MDKVIGITAEYDPFHNGHAYMLEESVRLVSEKYGTAGIISDKCGSGSLVSEKHGSDRPPVVICMSGNFTQRGEPALIDKWARAEMAMSSGADLVVELPVIYAVNDAGNFAYGGVKILEALGADIIAFGSETCALDALRESAERRKSVENREDIRELIKEGYSYPRALSEVLGETMMGPNDTLGIEYIRHMSKAEPLPIFRTGAGHSDTSLESESEDSINDKRIASAGLIRKKFRSGEKIDELVPGATLEIMCRGTGVGDPNLILPLIREMAARAEITDEDLNRFYGAEEGLGDLLIKNFRMAGNWDELVDFLKSKRYTRTRIQRTLIHMLLRINRNLVRSAPLYTRVLAMNDTGAGLIRDAKKKNPGFIIINGFRRGLRDHPEIDTCLKLDSFASDIYNIALGRDMYSNSEYVKKPLKL